MDEFEEIRKLRDELSKSEQIYITKMRAFLHSMDMDELEEYLQEASNKDLETIISAIKAVEHEEYEILSVVQKIKNERNKKSK